MAGSSGFCGEVAYHNIDLEFTPSMLLNLKGWRCDFPLRGGECRVQIKDCLHDVFSEWWRAIKVLLEIQEDMLACIACTSLKLTFFTTWPMSSLLMPRR